MKRMIAGLSLLLQLASFAGPKILFIRGGTGTVGFFEGGADEQGADVFNYLTNGGNHGWGELNAALVAEGFDIEQLAENPVSQTSPYKTPTPVPLDTLDLSQYALIVFGSNNAEYTAAQVDAFVRYIHDGGAGLLISDANFGQFWGDAPSSDQAFLTPFGLEMNQDQGTYALTRTGGDYLQPNHPILSGVNSFDGEGVSPITVLDGSPEIEIDSTNVTATNTIISRAKGNVRRNTRESSGPSTSNTAADGTLVITTFGSGRMACHFDRNTFFNLNGAGTNIRRLDNEKYARNLFNWLIQPGFTGPIANYAPRLHFPSLTDGQDFLEGQTINVQTVPIDPDGSVSSVSLTVDGQIPMVQNSAPFDFSISGLEAGTHLIAATVTDDDGAATTVSVTVNVLSTAGQNLPLSPATFTLSATNRPGDVGLAVDGIPDTRWATGAFQTDGQAFTINLGSRKMLSHLVLETAANPNDYPRGYTISGSDNGSDFTALLTGTGNSATTVIQFDPLPTYQYYRITQTGSSSVNWWSIHEMEIFAAAANTVLTQGEWQRLHFGEDLNNPANEAAIYGDLVDADSDGLVNRLEFAFNLNPLEANPLKPVRSAIFVEGGTTAIDLTFRRWRENNGLVYHPEFSTSLLENSWNDDPAITSQTGTPVDNNDGTETVTLRITPPAVSDNGFVRLRIE